MRKQEMKNVLAVLVVVCLALTGQLRAQLNGISIGSPLQGSFTESGGVYTVVDRSYDIWDTEDSFNYVYVPMSGDGTMTARVRNMSNTNPWAKAGVMIREGIHAESKHAMMIFTPQHGCDLQWRSEDGEETRHAVETGSFPAPPVWVKIERVGDTFKGSYSTDGQTWNLHGSVDILMGADAYIGLCLTSGNAWAVNTTVFDNVNGTIPTSQPQCGETVVCPVTPLPWPTAEYPSYSTETGFTGDYFVTGLPHGSVCFQTTDYIRGVTQSKIDDQIETQLFTAPNPVYSPGSPAIEIIRDGVITPYILKGRTIHAGGVACFYGIDEIFAITDQAVGIVATNKLTEHLLPLGTMPLRAGGLGAKMGHGGIFTLYVETSLPSIECYMVTSRDSFPIPASSVAPPETYTNASLPGVIVYTDSTVYVIERGTMRAVQLGGSYISHAHISTGVDVTHTGGTLTISLGPPGVNFVPFSACDVPLDVCGSSGSSTGIAMNIAADAKLDAVPTVNPALGSFYSTIDDKKTRLVLSIGPIGGGPRKLGNKTGTVIANAHTTLGGLDSELHRSRIWNGGTPGTPGTPAEAMAWKFAADVPPLTFI